mgnify:FL=1
MGFIKHFSDDMPCSVVDRPNLYFPMCPTDRDKEMYSTPKWVKCYYKGKLIAKVKTFELANYILNNIK